MLPLAYSLRLQAFRYDIKGLVLSTFGNTSFAGVYREESKPEPVSTNKPVTPKETP